MLACAGQVAVLRLLQQLSQVYSVMRVASLAALVPFFTFGEVEQLIVDAVKHNYLHVRAPPHALSMGPWLRVMMYFGSWQYVELECTWFVLTLKKKHLSGYFV